MITTAAIMEYDGEQLIVIPSEDISLFLAKYQSSSIEIRLDDGRTITSEQRKKIFGIIRDIALWSGEEPERIRQLMTWDYVGRKGIDYFSLSDTNITTAREYINYLIEFCFQWAVPTRHSLVDQTDDIDKYLYSCLYHKKCAICNKQAEVHHVDKIGMGRNRERIVHVGLRAIALCRSHHIQVHSQGEKLLKDNHVYGIRLDSKLCARLMLKSIK